MKKKIQNWWGKGFTLAELLIVVAIIGVLVAISIPIFIAQHNKAVDAVNKSNIRAAKSMAATALYDSSTNFIADVHGTTNAYFTYSDGKFERITGKKPHQIKAMRKTGHVLRLRIIKNVVRSMCMYPLTIRPISFRLLLV